MDGIPPTWDLCHREREPEGGDSPAGGPQRRVRGSRSWGREHSRGGQGVEKADCSPTPRLGLQGLLLDLTGKRPPLGSQGWGLRSGVCIPLSPSAQEGRARGQASCPGNTQSHHIYSLEAWSTSSSNSGQEPAATVASVVATCPVSSWGTCPQALEPRNSGSPEALPSWGPPSWITAQHTLWRQLNSCAVWLPTP